MSELQSITNYCIETPSIEKSSLDNLSHLVRIVVTIGSETQTKELLLHIQVAKNGKGWELHGPTLEKIKGRIIEEGFDPETFNFELFKCRALNGLR